MTGRVIRFPENRGGRGVWQRSKQHREEQSLRERFRRWCIRYWPEGLKWTK